MSKKEKFPVTAAIRMLKSHKADYTELMYAYEEKGGTRVSARELGVDEHAVIKTIVMETDGGEALIVLMHGDREISTKDLARLLQVKTVQPCTPDRANLHTGYLVGGTSPFGTRKALPVYAEQSIFDLNTIYINGGKRGFLIAIQPKVLQDVLKAVSVEVSAS